jgi:hypothetical protein
MKILQKGKNYIKFRWIKLSANVPSSSLYFVTPTYRRPWALFNDVPSQKPAASSAPTVTFADTRGVSHKDVASLCLQQKVSALQTDYK